MPKKQNRAAAVIDRLRQQGLARYPGAELRSPWPGHLDLVVKDKTFAFLSAPGDPPSMSLKLPLSRSIALGLPDSKPTPYGLGKSGWVSLTFAEHAPPPLGQLQEWIDESYRAVAPKKLLAEFEARLAPPTRRTKAATKPAKKPAPKPAKPGKKPRREMKSYASFDLYLADQTPAHQRLIRALRQFVARTAPQLQEAVKWSNGCWLAGKAPVAYVYAAEDYVQFGFVRGSSLKDPRGLLEGNGQYVRHIKVRKPADIDAEYFAMLLRQAAR